MSNDSLLRTNLHWMHSSIKMYTTQRFMEWLGDKLSGQSSWYTIAKAYIGIKLVIINTENHRSQKKLSIDFLLERKLYEQ